MATGGRRRQTVLVLFLIAICLLISVYELDITLEYNQNREAQGYLPNWNSPPPVSLDCANGRILHRDTLAFQDVFQGLAFCPRAICRCPLFSSSVSMQKRVFPMSECSEEATNSGLNQKVISFSHSNISKATFITGIQANLKAMRKFFPGWVMRIYTATELSQDICSLVCAGPDIFFCNLTHLELLDEITPDHLLEWRSLPLGDATVLRFIQRDVDSRLSQRERDAVAEWEKSDRAFHMMRDHPNHNYTILGGLLGADNQKICWDAAEQLRKDIFLTRRNETADETLSRLIYMKYQPKFLTHDSFFCSKYQDGHPFPSKRPDPFSYVGKKELGNVHLLPECPLACRPPKGQNWTYC